MKPLTFHGACGKSWLQVGNSTGHCGGCHETFSSVTAFDAHQSIKDGRSTCIAPSLVKLGRVPLVGRPDPRSGVLIWGKASREEIARAGGPAEGMSAEPGQCTLVNDRWYCG